MNLSPELSWSFHYLDQKARAFPEGLISHTNKVQGFPTAKITLVATQKTDWLWGRLEAGQQGRRLWQAEQEVTISINISIRQTRVKTLRQQHPEAVAAAFTRDSSQGWLIFPPKWPSFWCYHFWKKATQKSTSLKGIITIHLGRMVTIYSIYSIIKIYNLYYI